MQSLINFSFSQCTDKGMFYSFLQSLFLSVLLLIVSLSFTPMAPSSSPLIPPITEATSSLPRQRPPSELLFLKNHRIPFSLSLTLLSPNYSLTLFLTPISYFTWTECRCCLFLPFVFLQELSWAHEQTGTIILNLIL